MKGSKKMSSPKSIFDILAEWPQVSTFRKPFGQGGLDKRDKEERCWLRNDIRERIPHVRDNGGKESSSVTTVR